jgi:hypothetical protein
MHDTATCTPFLDFRGSHVRFYYRFKYQQELIFYTRLNVLDGDSVLVSDRQEANERFDRTSVEQMRQKLQAVNDLHTGLAPWCFYSTKPVHFFNF